MKSYQLPVERSPGEHALCAEESAVVLGLCTDTETLHDLAQVDEVQELVHGVIAAQGTGKKGDIGCKTNETWKGKREKM